MRGQDDYENDNTESDQMSFDAANGDEDDDHQNDDFNVIGHDSIENVLADPNVVLGDIPHVTRKKSSSSQANYNNECKKKSRNHCARSNMSHRQHNQEVDAVRPYDNQESDFLSKWKNDHTSKNQTEETSSYEAKSSTTSSSHGKKIKSPTKSPSKNRVIVRNRSTGSIVVTDKFAVLNQDGETLLFKDISSPSKKSKAIRVSPKRVLSTGSAKVERIESKENTKSEGYDRNLWDNHSRENNLQEEESTSRKEISVTGTDNHHRQSSSTGTRTINSTDNELYLHSHSKHKQRPSSLRGIRTIKSSVSDDELYLHFHKRPSSLRGSRSFDVEVRRTENDESNLTFRSDSKTYHSGSSNQASSRRGTCNDDVTMSVEEANMMSESKGHDNGSLRPSSSKGTHSSVGIISGKEPDRSFRSRSPPPRSSKHRSISGSPSPKTPIHRSRSGSPSPKTPNHRSKSGSNSPKTPNHRSKSGSPSPATRSRRSKSGSPSPEVRNQRSKSKIDSPEPSRRSSKAASTSQEAVSRRSISGRSSTPPPTSSEHRSGSGSPSPRRRSHRSKSGSPEPVTGCRRSKSGISSPEVRSERSDYRSGSPEPRRRRSKLGNPSPEDCRRRSKSGNMLNSKNLNGVVDTRSLSITDYTGSCTSATDCSPECEGQEQRHTNRSVPERTSSQGRRHEASNEVIRESSPRRTGKIESSNTKTPDRWNIIQSLSLTTDLLPIKRREAISPKTPNKHSVLRPTEASSSPQPKSPRRRMHLSSSETPQTEQHRNGRTSLSSPLPLSPPPLTTRSAISTSSDSAHQRHKNHGRRMSEKQGISQAPLSPSKTRVRRSSEVRLTANNKLGENTLLSPTTKNFFEEKVDSAWSPFLDKQDLNNGTDSFSEFMTAGDSSFWTSESGTPSSDKISRRVSGTHQNIKVGNLKSKSNKKTVRRGSLDSAMNFQGKKHREPLERSEEQEMSFSQLVSFNALVAGELSNLDVFTYLDDELVPTQGAANVVRERSIRRVRRMSIGDMKDTVLSPVKKATSIQTLKQLEKNIQVPFTPRTTASGSARDAKTPQKSPLSRATPKSPTKRIWPAGYMQQSEEGDEVIELGDKKGVDSTSNDKTHRERERERRKSFIGTLIAREPLKDADDN